VSGKETPATKALDAAGVDYRLHEYIHDPSVASYGLEAALAVGVDPSLVHKTLLVTIDRSGKQQLVVAVVPVDAMLDFGALAAAVGAKRAAMAAPALAERSTGYVVGGISPLGQRRPLLTVIDADAAIYDTIFVSGGRRGLDIELSGVDLARVTSATFAPIARR
jgi:Cys-tRNA(Pro)/Cys-tRNA(Cys) deacylase